MDKQTNEFENFPDSMVSDKRPQKGGWASGNYTATCYECKIRFMGDKRATSCADCAYKPPKPPTKKQVESMRAFVNRWTVDDFAIDNEYIKEKYPQVYEAAKRMALDEAVIDAACDDMRARCEG